MKRLIFTLFTTLAATELVAQEFAGPLRIQDMSPVSLVRLDMLPPPAKSDATWRFELTTSQANVYAMDAKAEQWLDEHGPLTDFTEEHAQDLLRTEGHVFLFDSEMSLTNFIVTRRVSRNGEVEVVLPYHHVGGGYFDSAIEGFHRAVGLDDAGRPLVPRNHVAIVARNGGSELLYVDTDGTAGLGDATVTYRYGNEINSRWRYVVEGAVRLPTGKGELYFSSDDPNYGVQGTLQRVGAKQAVYLTANYVIPGHTRLVDRDLRNVPTAIAAYERAISARTTAIVQGSWSKSALHGTNIDELTRARNQISIGLRQQRGNSSFWIALTENVANYRNTPDIGVHLGIARISGGGKS